MANFLLLYVIRRQGWTSEIFKMAIHHDGGNYLINFGPKADGSISAESSNILSIVGAWMGKNGASLYGAGHCQ